MTFTRPPGTDPADFPSSTPFSSGRDKSRRWPHDPRCAHELRGRLLSEAASGGGAVDPHRLRHRVAEAIAEHCGHSRLRGHRLAFGWSIAEAVSALRALARAQGSSCGVDARQWARWEKGAHPGPYNLDLLARLFRTRADRLGLAPDHTDYGDELSASSALPERTTRMFPDSAAVNTDAAAGTGANQAPAGTGTPHRAGRHGRGSENEIIMAARESAQYHSNLSHIGPADVDLLRDEVVTVAGMFANAPRMAVFSRTRELRDHTFGLLDTRLRATEFRDLYFIAGALCGMLAEITENLGYLGEAMAHARTGWLCADQAGHDGLKAWLLGEQSVIAYNSGRSGQAAGYARRGQMHALSDSFRVELPALEARAAATLGDAEAARTALVKIDPAREHVEPADLDYLSGIFGCTVPKQHHYTAESALWIGDATAAIADAQACVSGYQDGPEHLRALDNEASAQLNMAMAHLVNGDLDAVRDAAEPAFGLAPELRTASVNHRFRRLHRQLTTPAVRESPTAVALRDQIEDHLAAVPG